MKLIKVTKGGALHFELSDGRLGVTYPSGYVRVSLKTNYGKDHSRLYQINKKTSYKPENSKYKFYKRELIPIQRDRINHLILF